MTPERAQTIIESLDSNTDLKQNTQACKAIEWAVQSLDQGSLRIASYSSTSKHWVHHAWLQKAVSLYFKIKPIQLCQHPWPHRDVVPGKYATTHQVEQAIHQRMVPVMNFDYIQQ